MLDCEVARQLAYLSRVVTPVVLTLLKFAHGPVQFEHLARPHLFVLHLLTQFFGEKVAAPLCEQNLEAEHVQALLQKQVVEIFHLAGREPAVDCRHSYGD